MEMILLKFSIVNNLGVQHCVHVFTGEKKMVAKPASAPDWLPDKINKANVKKVRIDRI